MGNSWSVEFKIEFGVRQGSVCHRSCLLYVDDVCDLCKPRCNLFVILYADDILLLSPTVTAVENCMHACERELNWLDMAINCKRVVLLLAYRPALRHPMC